MRSLQFDLPRSTPPVSDLIAHVADCCRFRESSQIRIISRYACVCSLEFMDGQRGLTPTEPQLAEDSYVYCVEGRGIASLL